MRLCEHAATNTIRNGLSIMRYMVMLFTVLLSFPLWACSGLDYCPMPVEKHGGPWTFFQNLQHVNYDNAGTKSYVQWTPRVEFSVSDTWRLGAHVPFISLTDKGESGFGNAVFFTDLALSSAINNRWIVGVQGEMVTGRTDHGISASSPQLLPYVTWLPRVGDFQWVTTLGYRYSFGSHETAAATSALASISHAGHSHAKVETIYSVNAHAKQELLGRLGVRFPIWDQVALGLYTDTVYVLDSKISGTRFLATGSLYLFANVLENMELTAGGSLPVTIEKRDLGSLFLSMRLGL